MRELERNSQLAQQDTQQPSVLDEEEGLEEQGRAQSWSMHLMRGEAARGDHIRAKLASEGAGGGSALPGGLQGAFEDRLGAGLGQVRVHTGPASQAANAAMGARAFTVGQDVHFGKDQYRPGEREGDRLLAHEVVHTVQQGAGPAKVQAKTEAESASSGDAAEKEADEVSDDMMISTEEKSSSTSYGFGTRTTKDSTKTTTFEDGKASTTETANTGSASVIDPGYSWNQSTKTDGKESETSKKVGLSGASYSKNTSEKSGDGTKKSATTGGLSRGDGQLGLGGSKTVTKGQFNEDGKLEHGTEKSGNAKASLSADPDKGVGAGGNLGGGFKAVDGPSSVSGGGSLSGKVLLNVTQVAGKDPPAFQVTMTISFGGSLNLGTGHEHGGGKDEAGNERGSAQGSVTGGASATGTAAFTHLLDEAAAKQYVEAVKSGGVTAKPKYPEWQIIDVGLKSDWAAAKKFYDEMLGNASAKDAAAMKEGDVVEMTQEIGGEVKGSLGGKQGGPGLGVGVEGGMSQKGTLGIKRAMLKDGIVQITVTSGKETGQSAGGNVSMGAAGGGASFGSTEGGGRSVTFNLNSKAPEYEARFQRIMAARSIEEIEKLAQDVDLKSSLDSSQKTKSDADTEAVKLNAGPVAAELGGGGTVSEENTYDAEGKSKSTKVTGDYSGGGKVGVGDYLKVGDSQKESYTGETEVVKVVDKDGKVVEKRVAKGDLTVKTTASSWDKTKDEFSSAVDKGSIAPFLGSPIKEQEKTGGRKLHDDDIRSVIARAKGDLGAWMTSVTSPRLRPLWQKCRTDIRAACPGEDDSKWNLDAVQLALANWRKEAYKGGNDAILSAAGGGGFAYHFPEGTWQIKPLFEAIVGGYPAQTAEVLQAEGKLAEAKTDCETQLAKAQKLYDLLLENSNKFDPEKYASMLDGAWQAKTKLEGLLRTIKAQLEPKKAPPPKPAAQPVPPGFVGPPTQAQQDAANQAAAEKAAAAGAALPGYYDMVDLCRKWQEAVGKLVGKAEAELNTWYPDHEDVIVPNLNEAKKILAQWETRYWAAFQLMEQHSFERAFLEKHHPAGMRGYYDRVYKRSIQW